MRHKGRPFYAMTAHPARRIALLMVAGLVFAAPAFAEYRLSVGDVVELSVIGIPDLKQRTTVNLDGEISISLIGPIKAAGLPLSEVRARVKELIPAKPYPLRTNDGRENFTVIAPEEIALAIVEYAPIYTNGDVAKPGEQIYRPGMTVRQAIAVAGGYDLVRSRTTFSVTESLDLRSSYETLWMEFVKEQARVWRLEAERDGKETLKSGDLPEVPLPPSAIAEVLKTEADHLSTRNADSRKEKSHLEAAIRQTAEHLAILSKQRQAEEEGSREDAAEFERVKALFEKGNTQMIRVTDAKRAMLLSSTRVLQTTAQVAQVERDREELRRKLQMVDDRRRIEVLRELQEARDKLAQAVSRIQATSEKLQHTGTLKSRLARGKSAKPEIAIIRKTDSGGTRGIADEDTVLLPGDVVEITLDRDDAAAAFKN